MRTIRQAYEKVVPFKRVEGCQNAFKIIKAYLTKPSILAHLVKGKPLMLHITALEHSPGAPLAQENGEGKENALYYLNRNLIGPKGRYSPLEKVCLALIFAIQKLQDYLQHHHNKLI